MPDACHLQPMITRLLPKHYCFVKHVGREADQIRVIANLSKVYPSQLFEKVLYSSDDVASLSPGPSLLRTGLTCRGSRY